MADVLEHACAEMMPMPTPLDGYREPLAPVSSMDLLPVTVIQCPVSGPASGSAAACTGRGLVMCGLPATHACWIKVR
jgi:hypothetical protein